MHFLSCVSYIELSSVCPEVTWPVPGFAGPAGVILQLIMAFSLMLLLLLHVGFSLLTTDSHSVLVQISKVFSWCQVWPFSSVLFWPACLSLNSLQQSRVGALMYIFPIGVLQAWNCLQAESVAWQGSPHPLPLLLVCLFTETENTCFLYFIWLLACLPRECLCFWIIFLHGWRKKF